MPYPSWQYRWVALGSGCHKLGVFSPRGRVARGLRAQQKLRRKFRLELDANDASWDWAKVTVQSRLAQLRSPDTWNDNNTDFARQYFIISANPKLAEELDSIKDRVRLLRGDTNDAETTEDTSHSPRTSLVKADAMLKAACQKLQANEERYQEALERYCERLNRYSPQGEDLWGDAYRRSHRLQESYLRVKEKFKRTAFLPLQDAHGPRFGYQPGPAEISQPLSEAEEAEVSRKRGRLAASVDSMWEEFQRRRNAKS
ncbi:MAG: hypothetical protein LQ341_007223 [Variospora aurantia]|nr:MAG: hypothetical protein LQ341_007223 [Variospora aurantia]